MREKILRLYSHRRSYHSMRDWLLSSYYQIVFSRPKPLLPCSKQPLMLRLNGEKSAFYLQGKRI